MGMMDDFKDKAADLVKDHADKVEGISDTLLEKAADAADDATGGKFSGAIDAAQDKADDAIGE
jgi:predicted hydrolase (HD superfamily)